MGAEHEAQRQHARAPERDGRGGVGGAAADRAPRPAEQYGCADEREGNRDRVERPEPGGGVAHHLIVAEHALQGQIDVAEEVFERQLGAAVLGQTGEREGPEGDFLQAEGVDELHGHQRPTQQGQRGGGDGGVAGADAADSDQVEQHQREEGGQDDVAQRVGVQRQASEDACEGEMGGFLGFCGVPEGAEERGGHAQHQVAVQPHARGHGEVGADQVEQAVDEPCVGVLFGECFLGEDCACDQGEQAEQRGGQADDGGVDGAGQLDQQGAQPCVHGALATAVVFQVDRPGIEVAVHAVVGQRPCVVAHADLVGDHVVGDFVQLPEVHGEKKCG